MDDTRMYPQGNISNEARDINIFIAKKIYNKKEIIMIPCYNDHDSGLMEICWNKKRIEYFTKIHNIFYLPAFLCEESAITSSDFFDNFIFTSQPSVLDLHKNNLYEKQKTAFIKDTLTYNNMHVSSYKLIHNYAYHSEILLPAIEKAIQQNLITRDDYIYSLQNTINSTDLFDICHSTNFNKAKALYNLLNKDIKQDNIFYFSNKK